MVDRASLAAKIALDNRANLNLLAKKVSELGSHLRDLSEKESKSEPIIVRGIDGRDGVDGKDAPKVTDEQIKSVAFEWLSANISQPKDGEKGEKGDAADQITAADIQLAVDIWFELNRDSIRGEKGEKGDVGAKGAKGDKGDDGKAPAHEWKGTAIRFQHPSGIWGKWVDLKGDPGASGGVIVGGGGGGGGLTKAQADLLYAPIGSVSSTQWVKLDGEPMILSFVSVGGGEVEMELVPV